MPQLFTEQFWQPIIDHPAVFLPMLLVALVVGFMCKKLLDDSVIKGTQSENLALRVQLEAARRADSETNSGLKKLETEFADLKNQIAGLKRPDVERAVEAVTTTTSEVVTSNINRHMLLEAEPGKYKLDYYKVLFKYIDDDKRWLENLLTKKESKD